MFCAWFCTFCSMCHANGCPKIWGGDPEVPCKHTTLAQSMGITYETGVDEPIHPDFLVGSRFVEVGMGEGCHSGCKVYADPRSNVKVLAHNRVYGCNITAGFLRAEAQVYVRLPPYVDLLV